MCGEGFFLKRVYIIAIGLKGANGQGYVLLLTGNAVELDFLETGLYCCKKD
jgi:hypothetical protein